MNLTTGPVEMRPEVMAALAGEPFGHRSAGFETMLADTKAMLRGLTGAAEVAVLCGTGTLANDAIAAHLKGRGLVLVNGEFGERLVRHVEGAGLSYEARRGKWGEPLRFGEPAAVSWVWAVHCETSTGELNDIDALKRFARDCGADLVLDCVSSIGAVPVDLDGVLMASAVSGKALASAAGAAIVLGSRRVSGQCPPYLDLGRYWDGNPYTFPTPTLSALRTALDRDWPARFAFVAEGGAALREGLRRQGLMPMGNAPHVVTIPVADAEGAAARLAERGIKVSAGSAYLAARNWIQACLMGEFTVDGVARAAEAIGEVSAC